MWGLCTMYLAAPSPFAPHPAPLAPAPACLQSTRMGAWYPILLITTFNLADMIGKLAPQQVGWEQGGGGRGVEGGGRGGGGEGQAGSAADGRVGGCGRAAIQSRVHT